MVETQKCQQKLCDLATSGNWIGSAGGIVDPWPEHIVTPYDVTGWSPVMKSCLKTVAGTTLVDMAEMIQNWTWPGEKDWLGQRKRFFDKTLCGCVTRESCGNLWVRQLQQWFKDNPGWDLDHPFAHAHEA